MHGGKWGEPGYWEKISGEPESEGERQVAPRAQTECLVWIQEELGRLPGVEIRQRASGGEALSLVQYWRGAHYIQAEARVCHSLLSC